MSRRQGARSFGAFLVQASGLAVMCWFAMAIVSLALPDAAIAMIGIAVGGLLVQVAITYGIGWLASGRHRIRAWPIAISKSICAWLMLGIVFGGLLVGVTGFVEFDWHVGVLVGIAIAALVALVLSVMLHAGFRPFGEPTRPPAKTDRGQRFARASVVAVAGSHRTFCVADLQFEGVDGVHRPASLLSTAWLIAGVSKGVMLCDAADRPIRFYAQVGARG